MITKTGYVKVKNKRWYRLLLLFAIMQSFVVTVNAQDEEDPPKKDRTAVYGCSSQLPSDYLQVGTTDLYYKIGNNYNYDGYCFDFLGKFGDSYYGSTYANCGYDVAMQVGDNSAVKLDCRNESVVNGVKFEANVIQQAELVRVCYYITNTCDRDTTISLGIHADVMIGNNDRAPIFRKIDTIGNTYGLSLQDGNGAQLCVLFGTGLVGVTGVSDFWFGGWSLNSSPYEMVGNYNEGGSWMIENGSYDSGMGWCWKNRIIPAGTTVVFSWLIGVGDVKLEPNSNFEVTPEDPDGWNDLSRVHVLSLEGDYESPAGLSGMIEYAVEQSEEWIALTDVLESGSTFRGEVRALFDPTLARHTIRFRTRDQVGNTTLLPSIVYPDVAFSTISGIEDKVYTGDSIYQTNVFCDLGADRFALKNYQNNVSVGQASFNVEGVFPYTIGRKTCNFTISPAPLAGEIAFATNTFVYSGEAFTPEWSFTESRYASLENDVDYTFEWADNVLPGTASLTVTGKGNYTGNLTGTFLIDKAPLGESVYQVTIPGEDVIYDGAGHGASIIVSSGVGDASFTYVKDGISQTDAPTEPGEYEVYLEIAEGAYYYGLSYQRVGAFTIYQFDETDWQNLQVLSAQMIANNGWTHPWDFSQGIASASRLAGLVIEQGHVVGLDLSRQGLEGTVPTSLFLFPALKTLDLSDNNLSGSFDAISDNLPNLTGQIPAIEKLNISGNSFAGNIGVIGNILPSLTKLDASNNKLTQVSPILPASIQELNLDGQDLGIIDYKDLYLSKNNVAEGLYNILFYDHAQRDYSLTRNLTLQSSDGDDWLMRLEDLGDSFKASVYSPYYIYKHANGDVLRCYSSDGTTNYNASVRMSFAPGDVNFDTEVSIGDLQQTVNYAVEQAATQLFNFTAADIKADEWVNVQDVVCVVNVLLDQEVGTRTMRNSISRGALPDEVADAHLELRGRQLVLISTCEVAAMDIAIENAVDVKWLLDDAGYNYTVNKKSGYARIIHYSMGNKSVKAGETVIAELTGSGLSILKADLVSGDATPLKVFVNGRSTAITDVPLTNDCQVYADAAGLTIQNVQTSQTLQWEVYNLGGLLLGKGRADLSAGTNTIECNLTGENQIVIRLFNESVNITKKVSINK